MKSKRLALPKKKYEYGYDLAYELAGQQLSQLTDVEAQCRKCDARYQPEQKEVVLDYFQQPCIIQLNNAEVRRENSEDTLSVREKLLVLHYFLQAKGTPLSGKPITYKELKDGVNYFPVFAKRAQRPLTTFFGDDPPRLPDIAGKLGGRPADFGDVAVTLQAFSRVPLTLALWRGDDEFPPEASILFDSTVSDYMTNDDLHNLCENTVWKLVKLSRSGGEPPGEK